MQPHYRVFPSLFVVSCRNICANSPLAAGAAQVIANLVAQDAHKPGALGGLAGESVARFEGGKEGVLHEVFGHAGVAHLADGEVEQVIPMRLDPIVGRRGVRLRLLSGICGVVHSERTYRSSRAMKRPIREIARIANKSASSASRHNVSSPPVEIAATIFHGQPRKFAAPVRGSGSHSTWEGQSDRNDVSAILR